MQPANDLLLFCQKYGLQAYIMSALCEEYPIWYIQSLIIALCAVLLLCHWNHNGNSTSISRIHNLESLCKSAWLPIFLQCIMLAHQEAFKIQGTTLIEVITNNSKPCWLNESKYLWNVLMCPFVFAHSEINCGVESTHENHWIILLDLPFNPSQSWFNHIEDGVHAPSRANLSGEPYSIWFCSF